ncbi:hypothetical protein [Niabella ginsengisoli]|uniref:Uncharacterized protein n=1 Tax=Niabella ginsengisoli TaxID=522298 RepID=A0ABS9SPX8_9BACT|nr:hypothetical protein [Niabella ginsengisoli]MCH5600169.1 hypothetical protein [Niabella ginsengisoli]
MLKINNDRDYSLYHVHDYAPGSSDSLSNALLQSVSQREPIKQCDIVKKPALISEKNTSDKEEQRSFAMMMPFVPMP